MVSERREAVRYWANFIAKNWPFVISFLSLAGISIYSTNDSMSKDQIITDTQNQVVEVAKQYRQEFMPAAVRKSKTIIEKHYINNCDCKKLIHENNVKYHGVKP